MPQYNLEQLRLQNFRAFSQLTKINFGSRITLLFGKGSVGKSTIIDAINILSSSYKNKTNILDKTNRFHLSKKGKLKEILLGFSAAEEKRLDGEESFSRGVDQFFEENKDGEYYPKKVNLFSKTDDPKNERFVSLTNQPIPKEDINRNKNLVEFVSSNVSFIENENSWRELYHFTYIYKDKLIKNLNLCRKFYLKQKNITDQIKRKKEYLSKIKKNNFSDKNHSKILKCEYHIQQLRDKRNKLIDDTFDVRGFNPAMFPFAGQTKVGKSLIDQHINFLQKKSNYKKFIKYISDDIKSRKKYLYKNYKLYRARDLINEMNFRQELLDDLGKVMGDISGRKSTFSEFLCVSLTTLCTRNFEFIDKELFKWNDKVSGKILSAEGMFKSCSNMFGPVLDQIKVVRHQENFNNVMRTLSQFSPTTSISSNFHKDIENYSQDINYWYSEFGYDFSISIDKVGPRGETEIMYKKDKFKIPADLGGSGAQHLLTFLTEVVSSKDNTILLEEPEKALHASMQIKLAKLFSECSKKNQLIIETHSENLLYGLLKEIRDKKIKKDEIKVIYVYMENGESKIDELELNEMGGFKSKWRDGFFTEKLDIL